MVLGNHDSQASGSQNNNNNNHNVEMGMDRISKLPDTLLLHILSFVPTKLVVSTSILSKRWKYLWKSIDVLDFRNWPFGYDRSDYDAYFVRILEETRFMKAVEKVLSSLDSGSNIRKFYVGDDKTIDQSRINEWITTVIQRNVEEISLLIEAETISLPSCFYTCESLIKLELKITSAAIFSLPESVSFPRLKSLSLTQVKFVDGNTIQQLISSCPVLEELTLSRCHLNDVSISAPTLKFLNINGQRLSYRDISGKCVVQIYAPSLLSFWYWQGAAKDYIRNDFPSLVDAKIDLKEVVGHRTKVLLAGLSNVKFLKMSGETFKALSSFADGIVTNLPKFSNLIKLEVHSEFPNGGYRTLLNFLQISPNLESLVFAQGFDYLSKHKDRCKRNLKPQLLQHLKSVEFRAFDGSPRELKLVKLFLENAKVLEKMAIAFRKNKIEEVIEQLLIHPRGSTSCAINFT